MVDGRWVNNKINHLHERSLYIVYKDSDSTFKDQLKNDNSLTVHHRNIQSLAIELFRVKENLSNTIMNEPFTFTIYLMNHIFQTSVLFNT